MGVGKNELIINDSNWRQHVDTVIDGTHQRGGLIPRDYIKHPQGCMTLAPPYNAVEMPLIPRSEWSDRIKDLEATKSRISDMRMTGNNGSMIPSKDQNGQGYCWAYSTTRAAEMLRMIAGLPYVALSAHAPACKVKNFEDEGGWCGLSLEFITKNGVPSEKFWPAKSMNRKYDTPETWENAALHKVTEAWVDLNAAVYDRQLTFDQMMTLLLSRVPVVTDFNWWSHSVLAVDPVEIEPGSFGPRIQNSWTDGWGENGMGVLQGNKGIPDGAVAPRVATPSES